MKHVIFSVLLTIILISLPLVAEDDFFVPKTTVGGYGELHFNYKKAEGAEASKTLDFHRFVLFFSHAWSEKWSFKAEVELEHNFVKNGQGELELEQAYIDYHPSDTLGFQVGVVLPAAGLVNEFHEPPLFMSVERPDYHKYIIPTTWFGNGLAVYGATKGFEYKLTIMEGLDGEALSLSNGIRNARRKGFKPEVDALLYNFRLAYTAIPGLRIGASYSYNNTQNDDGMDIPVHIAEGHVKYDANNVYAVFEIGRIGYGEGGLKTSSGYYFDIGYNIGSFFNTPTKIYPWFRWTEYDTAREVRIADFVDHTYRVRKWLVGLSIKPHPSIVFKAEAGMEKRGPDNAESNVFNIGAGYMF